MIDKSLHILLMVIVTVGGVVILTVTWVQPMPLSERIVPSFFGAVGIIGGLIWALVSRLRAAKVRVTSTPDKTDIKKETL